MPGQALVVTIDLGWGFNVPGGADLADYNLMLGSVVQIIMYDSDQYGGPGNTAAGNFDIMGSYGGDDISGFPYPGTEPNNVPTDQTAYDPFSVPDGHQIVYTASVQVAPYLDGNGNTWWQVYAQFEIVGSFDSLYVRVFGTDDLYQGASGAYASYWGLTGVYTTTNTIGTWFVGRVDETEADQLNYFYVIPEPGTVALFLLGGGALAASRFRRKRRSADK